jgi:HAD superfamily hydrolase (TIGR01458 family)
MKIDGLLLDLDGTLYLDDAPIDGAIEAISTLRERGVVCRYLTNTTRFSRRALAERLRRLGFPAHDDEVFTASLAAAQWLDQQEIHRIATYVPDAAREDFEEFGFDPIRPEAIVVGDLGERWDFKVMNRAFRQLLDGATLVALQKNRYWRTGRGLELDAGPFVAALEYAIDREAVVVGKPSRAFFELASASTGLPIERLAVVGDDVDVDIGGAHAAALRGILVRTGKFTQDRLDRGATVPHAILDSVANLPELFE